MTACRRTVLGLLAGAALLLLGAPRLAADGPGAMDAQRRYVVGVSGLA